MGLTKKIGIFGGAFDPIHNAHLKIAQYCLDHYALDQIFFVPTQCPLLKPNCIAKPWQRAAMVALAIINKKNFYLDTRELSRDQPSYALLTLQDLQKELAHDQLFWILGEDAFAEFTQWYRWQEIARLCDLLVMTRQRSQLDSEQKIVVETCFQQAGHQVIYTAMPAMDIASRLIRGDFLQHQIELPDLVRKFTIENNLYTTHRSSNDGYDEG